MLKKGDKVLCIRGDGTFLIDGYVYTIERMHETQLDRIILKGLLKYNWFSSRFCLLTPLTETLI